MFVEHKEAVEITEAPAKLMGWQRVLLRAADVIEECGWCQGAYSMMDGRVCAIGAIKVAIGLSPDDDEEDTAFVIARRAMSDALGVQFVHEWNDDEKRTKEEVTAKLRAVALGL